MEQRHGLAEPLQMEAFPGIFASVSKGNSVFVWQRGRQKSKNKRQEVGFLLHDFFELAVSMWKVTFHFTYIHIKTQPAWPHPLSPNFSNSVFVLSPIFFCTQLLSVGILPGTQNSQAVLIFKSHRWPSSDRNTASPNQEGYWHLDFYNLAGKT